jgi:hypothetical protein
VFEKQVVNPALRGRARVKALAKAKEAAKKAADDAAKVLADAAMHAVIPSGYHQLRAEPEDSQGSVDVSDPGITELLQVLWPVKADRDADDDGGGSRTNTYHKIVKVLKKCFGDVWLVPGVLTVQQMYKHINTTDGRSKQGLRWLDVRKWSMLPPHGALLLVLP